MPSTPTASWFHRILLPPIVLQSVLIGGGYSTGREVVEYAGKHGRLGWISVLVIFIGFSLLSILCFELARVCRVYDYKKWIQQLIGRLWPAFDLLLIAMFILVLSVMVSAVGAILETTAGLPNYVGILLAFTVAATLSYFGEHVIERFKTLGTLVLYFGYTVFAFVVLSGDRPPAPGLAGESSSLVESTALAALLSGILYVGYNASVYPVVLFTLHRQQTRGDTVCSGLTAGLMMTVPFALTWYCLLGFYPDATVFGADVPWLAMLKGRAGPWIVVLYGIVVGWTLVETCVGNIHAMLDRVDKNMRDLPDAICHRIPSLTRLHRAVAATTILLVTLLLSRFGVIALVASGYTLMAYGFIVLLILPLLTVGVFRIWWQQADPRV